MTSKKVSALKFVGTVSVGLLTGVSYTLSTVAAPALLTLPSASTASSALASLASASRAHLTSLSALSSAAFALAFALSPRAARHPYLLYTSLLAAASTLATPHLAPLLLGRRPARKTTPAVTAAHPASPPRAARTERGMDASYEVLGEVPSSTASASGEEENTPSISTVASSPGVSDQQNGEEVRAEVKAFAGTALVQAGLAAMSFAISVVGIWGDGVSEIIHPDAVFRI